MSLVTTDRIKETCNVVGLNDITLTGTLTGYKSFSSVMNVGDTCYYSIVDSFDGKWEIGIGTLSDSVTLQRTTVNTSSNNNNKVVFSSNVAKIVGLSFTAGQLDTSILKPTTATANQVLKYNGTTWLSANVPLTANEITTLVDANYIQVWRDTQTTAGTLSQFPKYGAITSSSGPIQGYSRGLLTSCTSGTITKTIFDGNLYASSVSTVLQYKSIGFNANDTGAANSVKSGRILLGQYGEVYLESSTKVNANTLTTATFDVLATQRPSGTTQTLDPHAINGGIHAQYAIGTTGAYNPQSNADKVSGGKIAQVDLYGVTRITKYSDAGGNAYIGRPAQIYLTATNGLTAADPDLAYDHAYDYKTTLSLGESAELVFQTSNQTFLRTPNMTEHSILTQGYADTRYAPVLANVTRANATVLGAGGAIRGDFHNFTSGAYTIEQYNGFLSDSNTTEPQTIRIGRTCITTSTGLPFLDNYYRASGPFSGIYSVKPQSNATAAFYMYNSGAVSALTEVVPGDSAPDARSKVFLGFGAIGENYPENVSGAFVSLEATDDNNGTIKSYVIANSTHAQSQLRLFAGGSGNLTMLYNANSILTRGYADTRYVQLDNNISQSVTGNGTFGIASSSGDEASIVWDHALGVDSSYSDDTYVSTFNLRSNQSSWTVQDLVTSQNINVVLTSTSADLFYNGNYTQTGNSLLTRSMMDTRYQQKPNTTFTGNFTSQDGRVVNVANGIITSVV